MNFLFGRGWVFEEEADDGAQGGAGGGAAGGDGGKTDPNAGGDAGAADAGAEDAAAAGEQGAEKKEEAPKDMKSAIDAALGYKKGPNGEALDPLTGKVKAEAPAKKPDAAAAEKKETETHHANGAAKKNDKGEALDDKGQVVKAAAPKVKTAAELDLKPEERKLLGTKANIRFGELINTVKAHEAVGAKKDETIKALSAARDEILGVLQETGTSQERLAELLEFNALTQSKDPAGLEVALRWVEGQRAALYRALGREPEGGGLDLLADFPDLVKQVEEEEITRKAALEIAHGRRDKAQRLDAEKRTQQQQQQQEQTVEQRKAAGTKALADIEKWTGGLQRSDIDYKAKEDRLLAKLDEVLKKYPPDQWLSTLQLLYDGIEITKAAPAAGAGKTPLRPSGARPGAKAPTSMLEAINSGLGYAGADKG